MEGFAAGGLPEDNRFSNAEVRSKGAVPPTKPLKPPKGPGTAALSGIWKSLKKGVAEIAKTVDEALESMDREEEEEEKKKNSQQLGTRQSRTPTVFDSSLIDCFSAVGNDLLTSLKDVVPSDSSKLSGNLSDKGPPKVRMLPDGWKEHTWVDAPSARPPPAAVVVSPPVSKPESEAEAEKEVEAEADAENNAEKENDTVEAGMDAEVAAAVAVAEAESEVEAEIAAEEEEEEEEEDDEDDDKAKLNNLNELGNALHPSHEEDEEGEEEEEGEEYDDL